MNQSPGKALIQTLLISNKVSELLEILKTFSLLSNITEYCSDDKSLHIKRKENIVIFNHEDEINSFWNSNNRNEEFDIVYNTQQYFLRRIKEVVYEYFSYEISFCENNINYKIKFEQTKKDIELMSLQANKPIIVEKETFNLNVTVKINENSLYEEDFLKHFKKMLESEIIQISLCNSMGRVNMSFNEHFKNANLFEKKFLSNVPSTIFMAELSNKEKQQESTQYLKLKDYFNYIKKENDHQLSKSIVECVLYNKQINKEYKELYSITKDIDFSFLENVLLSNNTLLSAFESKDSSKLSYNEIKTC